MGGGATLWDDLTDPVFYGMMSRGENTAEAGKRGVKEYEKFKRRSQIREF